MTTELPDLGSKYVVERPLARGGMAQVFLARHVGPGGVSRRVVVKTVTAEPSGEEKQLQLFVEEARIAALVSHPNIVHLYDFGEQRGVHFLVFEYLEGRSLDQILKAAIAENQALPPAFVAAVGAQVCAGLAYLHALKDAEGRPLGLVHRDVSPRNVVACADGAIKLLDLGITGLSRELGLIKGRPPYLSPEQCVAKALDGRSDLFSLGVVLWELVARRRLVTGDDLQQVANTITAVQAPRVRTVDPAFPETLADAIDRALELEPENRFANAAGMGRVFEEYLTQARQGPPPLPQALPGEAAGGEEVSPVVVAALADLERWSATSPAAAAQMELNAAPGQLSPPPPPGMPFTPAVGLEEPVARLPVAGGVGVVRIPDAEAMSRRNRRLVVGAAAAALVLLAGGIAWRHAFTGVPDDMPVFDKRFRVATDPEGAKVTLDGREVGTTPYVAATPLSAGDHQLQLDREGFAPVVRTVNAAHGNDLFVTLETVHLHTKAPTAGVEKPTPRSLPSIEITYPDAGEGEE
ncbi:MAG TPA: serine/threonine-protein kinase [Myxococcales bacterium]|jgi:serine/threonine protein kinase